VRQQPHRRLLAAQLQPKRYMQVFLNIVYKILYAKNIYKIIKNDEKCLFLIFICCIFNCENVII
jgi:hypothetical protein